MAHTCILKCSSWQGSFAHDNLDVYTVMLFRNDTLKENKNNVCKIVYVSVGTWYNFHFYIFCTSSYYTEVHYGSGRYNSFVSLVAHLMDTEYGEADTGQAEHEIQDIKFNSVSTKETLVSSFSNLYFWMRLLFQAERKNAWNLFIFLHFYYWFGCVCTSYS